MMQEIGEAHSEAHGCLQHPVKAFKALTEHAFGPMAVLLEFADAAALGHVGVLELITSPFEMTEGASRYPNATDRFPARRHRGRHC